MFRDDNAPPPIMGDGILDWLVDEVVTVNGIEFATYLPETLRASGLSEWPLEAPQPPLTWLELYDRARARARANEADNV